MPILDSSLQMGLINLHFSTKSTKSEGHTSDFFLRHLKFAADNIYKTLDTIESSIRFKKHLKNHLNFMNKFYGCNLSDNIFSLPIKNYYQYVFDHIPSKYKNKIDKPIGTSFLTDDYFQMEIFKPEIDFQDTHSWFLSNTPIAILCIDPFLNEESISLINLEIEILSASGLTLILCIYCKYDKNIIDHLINIIHTHKFAEIHFNLDFTDSENIISLLKKIIENHNQIEGYFYFYSQFFDHSISHKLKKVLKKAKNLPKFTMFQISKKLEKAFKPISFKCFYNTFICQNGFDKDKISLRLSNVPLYNTDNEETDSIPSEVSDLCQAYISPNQFLYWRKERVEIIYDDKMNNSRITKFVNFQDLHLIRIDMYVDKTIYLVDSNEKTLSEIEAIKEKSKKKDDSINDDTEDIHQEKAILLNQKKKFQRNLEYVCNMFDYCYKQTNHLNEFNLHDNQFFTTYEACKYLLKLNDYDSNGVIYQVETGEGKSFIVCLIAAALGLMKKTVHITSSNIKLSNRDYIESYFFFQQLGLTSAVFLHYDELPYASYNNSQNDIEMDYYRKFYPDIFYDEKLFKNSSNMNFYVCGIDYENNLTKNQANIIFSTFVNFECLYLRMMEMCPAYINKYFKNCLLIIDEADSILIDELTNGTILSRSLKTNAKEVLAFVYLSRIEQREAKDVLYEIKEKWPQCKDINIDDIESMYQEIDLIQQDEFSNGKKYSIETFDVIEKKNLKTMIDKSKEIIKNAKKKISKIFTKEEEENENIQKSNKYKQIIPFDYDHKGILEPNKEFSGFIQQFIAIKEMLNDKNNSNMIIKEISMNYLYVSHPIFVKLYDKVCGVTGTIGNKIDKKLFKKQYNFITKIIPRENSNFRVDFPIILCDDFNERNSKIVEEIIYFQKRGIPVLAIFHNLNEIQDVFDLLLLNGIDDINIFDGKVEKVRPDFIAGLKGAVSLGTNCCGRGTDIKNPAKPLHVIVTYFTTNTRVLNQAFGRTARQGQKGSTRIICLKSQFLCPIEILNETEMSSVLKDYKYKNKLQAKFIDKFKLKREWIFSTNIKAQKLNNDNISKLREARINVNRINAFNYEFPICMSISTFLKIQAQKIFSLYNCPNSKYTWMLFQKYIREMLLESWSLFISQTERKYFQLKIKDTYKNYLKSESDSLFSLLQIFLPDSQNSKDYGIVPTFMNIFNVVLQMYESRILSCFPEKLIQLYKQPGKNKFCSFTIGFKPFSLLDESGSRINVLNGKDQDQNYIKDPELIYIQKGPNNTFSLLSITRKIDDIFNWICRKINDVIGNYIGLKFFLRRTLGGCEFGVCYDFNIENNEDTIKNDSNCMIDRDPLLVFTISVKSMIPILAGILIIGLVYIASISESISEWITAFPVKITKKLVYKTMKEVASLVLQSQIERLCDKICEFLSKKIEKQIALLNKFKPNIAEIFTILLKIACSKDFSTSGDLINNLFEGKTKLKIISNFSESFIGCDIPMAQFSKIGFLLMLSFSSFMMNFHLKHKSVNYDSEKVSAQYNQNQNTQETLENYQKVVEKESIEQIEFE